MTSLAELREKKNEEREQHLIDLIKAGRPVNFIADTLGMNVDYAIKQIREVCLQHNLPRPPKGRAGDMPVGLDDESQVFRAKLGDHLYNLREKHHRTTLAQHLGIPPQSQAKASERPNAFNWSLGQMQRLAKHLGISFKELILRCILTEDEFKKVSPWIKF